MNFLNCLYIKLFFFFPLLFFSLKETDTNGSPVQETEETVLSNNPVYLKKRNTATFYEDSKKLRLDTVDWSIAFLLCKKTKTVYYCT